jgi:hypothetical protein
VAIVRYSHPMRTQVDSYTITEVPGIVSIKIEPSDSSEYGVHVLITDERNPHPQDYGLTELSELVQALEQAERLARQLAIDPPPSND